MKTLLKLITGTTLFVGCNLAMAHPGHQGESIFADAGHAFTNTDYLVGIAIACVVIYQLIKRTD